MNYGQDVTTQANGTVVTAENMIARMGAELDETKILFVSVILSTREADISLDELLNMCKERFPEREAELISARLREADRWCDRAYTMYLRFPSTTSLLKDLEKEKSKTAKRKFI